MSPNESPLLCIKKKKNKSKDIPSNSVFVKNERFAVVCNDGTPLNYKIVRRDDQIPLYSAVLDTEGNDNSHTIVATTPDNKKLICPEGSWSKAPSKFHRSS